MCTCVRCLTLLTNAYMCVGGCIVVASVWMCVGWWASESETRPSCVPRGEGRHSSITSHQLSLIHSWVSEWGEERGWSRGGGMGGCKREGGRLTKWSLTDWVSEPRSDGEGRGRERDSSFSVCCSGAFPLVCSLLLEVEGDDVSRTNLSDGQTLSETFSPCIHPDRSSSSVLGFCAQHLDFLIFVCFTVERFQSLNIWHHKSVFSYPIQIKTRFLLKNKLYKTVRRNTG